MAKNVNVSELLPESTHIRNLLVDFTVRANSAGGYTIRGIAINPETGERYTEIAPKKRTATEKKISVRRKTKLYMTWSRVF